MSGDGYDDLVDGVREALREAGLEMDSPELWLQLRQALDEVAQAPPPRPEPHLRVVEEDEPPPPPSPRSSVKVVRMSSPARTQISLDSGRLALAAGQWQTLFRGLQVRAYRVHVQTGQVDLAVDGELVERIEPGQSVDVEGSLIRAHGVTDASGLYLRLSSR